MNEWFYFSISLIGGIVLAKWATPLIPSIKNELFHIHHWMWATALILILYGFDVEHPVAYGIVTGLAVQGLSYKNWSIFTKVVEKKEPEPAPQQTTQQFEPVNIAPAVYDPSPNSAASQQLAYERSNAMYPWMESEVDHDAKFARFR